MSKSNSMTPPEAAKVSSLSHHQAPATQPAPERDPGAESTFGHRVMNAVGGSSPQEPPASFASLLARAQSPPSARAGVLWQLQRSYGNHYTGKVIQAKLAVSQPGDMYEREADRMAEQVMRAPDSDTAGKPEAIRQVQVSYLQRMCSECDKHLHTQPEKDEEEKKNIQTKEVPGQTPEVTPGLESRIQSLRGNGEPLPDSVRAFFEPRFGYDFGHVRIHTDAEAIESARAVKARAYTVGRDLVFGQGQYAPSSAEGKRLLAHELTHVLQQRSAGGTKLQRQPDNPDKPAENDTPSPTDLALSITDLTLAITSDVQQWLAQRDFSIDDPRARSAAREQSNAAKAAFNEMIKKHKSRKDTIEKIIKKIDLAIMDLVWTPNPLSEKDNQLLAEYEKALNTLREGKERELPDEMWNDGQYQDAEKKERSYTSKLGQLKGKARIAIVEAFTASTAYANALGRFRSAKTALRKKLAKMSIFDPEKGSIRPCVKPSSRTNQPTKVSQSLIDKIKAKKSTGEGMARLPYVALEGACTIGYGHVIRANEAACAPGPGTVTVGSLSLQECTCKPPLVWSEAQAEKQLGEDLAGQGKWIKENVLLDLDQEQFDAFVDLTAHVGSVPSSFLSVAYDKLCSDDEAVRKAYMNTALGVAGNPQAGEKFRERREERVWPSKSGEGEPAPTPE